ncbi:hypothetical protein [Erwinia sp. SLM-02]|uniref:hypothetical protein n=1 Tax=Erwinia sp. SLM-02 TaxID=3020057 RepID=UPI0028D25515|nr:hypothetical protein [uncultured Erwinia sp.]
MTLSPSGSVEQKIDHTKRDFSKKILWQALHGGVFYIFLSFFLLLGIRFDNGDFINKKFVNVFFENLAPDSIMILVIVGGMLTVSRMMVIGPNQEEKPVEGWFFRFAVFPVINTGKILAISGLGMMIGLFIACTISVFPECYAAKAFRLVIVFIAYIIGFSVMEYLGKYGYRSSVGDCLTYFTLALLLVLMPCLYVWAN